MKLRHAAALSLMAWYLMVPPRIPNTGEVNKSVPLSQWIIRRSFPRNQGCEAAKDRLQKQGLANQAEVDAMGRRAPHNPEFHCVLCQAQCVADDDPRLKSN
jgi:hypothetical protein